ncbi:hypothetical protein QTO34_003214 [Cnephaeus nilssonii]|uniref:Uncharacterized protein n=1 Tax=Cnephaeus nilssonii TaxID=3371016 RepID=A0AA40LKZ1_CNENI|nr:hypothetical protein QTO34_003214 [Eptesicus nilssonii]
MTGKIPLGVASPYVKTSSGGCTDPMKFYATTYCTAYGREEFKPRTGSHRGTGYKSNYRPVVSFHAGLHAPDHPAMGEQVRDSFQTVTGQSYRPLEVPDGKCPLPGNLYQTSSGYSLEKAGTAPTIKEVVPSPPNPTPSPTPTVSSIPTTAPGPHHHAHHHGHFHVVIITPIFLPVFAVAIILITTITPVRKVHFDTQDYGPQAITGLEPKQVPLLQQQQSKGSVEWENARHGPRFMTSEYNSKYLREPSSQPDLLQKKSIGAKEESGFTEASAKNPIASQALPGDPALLPGRSTSKADFLPMAPLHGPPPGPERSSVTHWQFQHPQRVQQTNVSLLGREMVGNKEPTGYSLNNAGYVRSPYDPGLDNPYLTSYNQGSFAEHP